MSYRVCALSILGFIFSASLVKAENAGHGEGTYAIVDGNTVLSDPFYKAVGDQHSFKDFRQEIKDYLAGVQHILDVFGFRSDSFWTSIGNVKAVYITIPEGEESSVPCKPYTPPLSAPAADPFQYGCTKGFVTYLFEKKFTAANVREQAKAILHERLWTQNPDVDQRFLAQFSTIAAKLSERHDNQILRGDRTPFTDADFQELEILKMAAAQLDFDVRSYDRDRVVVNGGGVQGGLYHVDDSTFVSLGSTFSLYNGTPELTIKNSVILDSDISTSKVSNSQIESSTLMSTEIADSSVIHSSVTGGLISHSKIEESQIEYVNSTYGKVSQSAFQYLDILATENSPTQVSQSHFLTGELYIGQTVKNSKVREGVTLYRFSFTASRYRVLDIQSRATVRNFKYEGDSLESYVQIGADTDVENLSIFNQWVFDAKRIGDIPFVGVLTLFEPEMERLSFRSKAPLDFNNLKCQINQRTIEVKQITDLSKVCH